MKIQIFASDLDGTLLNEESRISDKTAKTVKRAQSAGKRFMAVTGRAWGTAYPIFQEAGIEADCVLLNGAEFRTAFGEVIFQEAIEKNLARKIIEYLIEVGIDFEINTDNADFTTNRQVCPTALEFRDYAQLLNRKDKILKFFVFSNDIVLVENVKRHFEHWQGISVTSSSVKNVEITSDKAKKGTMLEKAAEFYHVDKDEVMVFGDGENDETMFREFGHSRAVKNAVPLIRELAERVIDSNQENGVAKEMNQVLGG